MLKPARERVTGRFGLRALPGGFGTAPFGDVMQIHVDGTELVFRDGGDGHAASRSTASTPTPPPRSRAGSRSAPGVLEELRAETALEHDPTPPQLWPEHFDVAIELGAEARGVRAGYGASPGRRAARRALPLRGAVERPPCEGELWNATAFTGAELSYAELLASDDRRAAALDFFRARRDELLTREAEG